jgi:AcrR family transcriptional regulator
VITTPGPFRRARRPEQVQLRRESILRAAQSLLEGRRVDDVSLRELGDEVGLAMSNVLRYFDSREAVFLEVLDAAWRSWLDPLEPALRDSVRGQRIAGPTRARRVAAVLAESLIERPLLCELFSVQVAVLERKISLDYARDFKRRVFSHHDRLAAVLRQALPTLADPSSRHCARMVVALTAGLWPYSHPIPAVATALSELGQPQADDYFRATLRSALEYQLIGAGLDNA